MAKVFVSKFPTAVAVSTKKGFSALHSILRDPKAVAGILILYGGYHIIPHLPEYIDRLFEVPDHVMQSDYRCHVKAGEVEVDFERNNIEQKKLKVEEPEEDTEAEPTVDEPWGKASIMDSEFEEE